MTTWRTLTLTLVLMLSIGLIIYIGTMPSQTPSPNSSLRERLETMVALQGSRAAYLAVKEDYADQGYDMQHNVAHMLGETIYRHDGLRGVTVCDGEFNYGCYHGFFARAVQSEGVSVLAPLDNECTQLPDGRASVCQHGLGHGLIEFFGTKGLISALDACTTLEQPNPVAGCTSGVFMGFNLRFESASDDQFITVARPIMQNESPYAPCDIVPERFRQSCFHELPQWWNQVFEGDFTKLGALCAAIADSSLRTQCVQGIGGIAASSARYDVAATSALCGMLHTSEDINACVVTASWSFEENNGAQDKAAALCATLPKELQTQCPV